MQRPWILGWSLRDPGKSGVDVYKTLKPWTVTIQEWCGGRGLNLLLGAKTHAFMHFWGKYPNSQEFPKSKNHHRYGGTDDNRLRTFTEANTYLLVSLLSPVGIGVWNPAFDVTPHDLITGGIITELGVFAPKELRAALSTTVS